LRDGQTSPDHFLQRSDFHLRDVAREGTLNFSTKRQTHDENVVNWLRDKISLVLDRDLDAIQVSSMPNVHVVKDSKTLEPIDECKIRKSTLWHEKADTLARLTRLSDACANLVN